MTNKGLPKNGTTLIADDIRFEKGNKISLMGIYGDDIIFETLPGIISKLCFLTRISGGDGEHPMMASLKDPDGNELFVGNPEMKLSLTGGIGYITNGLSPFQPSKEGTYTYRIFLDGKEFFHTAFTVKTGKTS